MQKLDRHHSERVRQAGITLLEVLLSITLMGLVSVGLAQLTERYTADVKNSVVAEQLKRNGDAARSFIKDNYSTIVSTATSSSPYLITTAMLVSGGYLPTASTRTNGYSQSICTLVLQPSSNTLRGMVFTQGGTTLDDLTLGNIVQLAGSSAGAILTSASSAVTGAMGGWSVPVSTWHSKTNNLGLQCDGTTSGSVQVVAGHPAVALWFEDGSYQSNSLYRDAVSGHTELNTVNTPIIFNATQVVGDACTTSAALANDSSGNIISCTSGYWKKLTSIYWADPVSTYASLPTCSSTVMGATRVVYTPTVGTGPRAYTCNGSSWLPLAIDDSGNLTVAGQISVGSSNRIYGNGSQGSYGATTIAGQKNGWTGLEFRDSSGTYQINQMTNRSNIGYYDLSTGRWLQYTDTAGNLTLDQTADYVSGRLNPGWGVETWSCTTGQISKAAYTTADGWAWNGKTLSCQSGVWVANTTPATGAMCGQLIFHDRDQALDYRTISQIPCGSVSLYTNYTYANPTHGISNCPSGYGSALVSFQEAYEVNSIYYGRTYNFTCMYGGSSYWVQN